MRVVLPSGLSGELNREEDINVPAVASSISEWILNVIETFVRSDALEEPDNIDDDEAWEAWEEEYEEYRNAYNQELSGLLSSDFRQRILSMDGDIEEAHIEHEENFERTIYVSEEIDVLNGIRTNRTPEESILFGKKIATNFDFNGDPGKVIYQKWEDGRWETIH